LRDLSEVPLYWEENELDWGVYELYVEWGEKEWIHTIADLKSRVVSQQEYEILWLKQCEKMQQDLDAQRRLKRNKS